jgi:hypothetical protein
MIGALGETRGDASGTEFRAEEVAFVGKVQAAGARPLSFNSAS